MSQFLKWAAEMDRAASVAEAESDGSPQFLAIIDGNRAIAEALRQGAALEARLESTEHERIIAEGQLAALSEIHPFHHWGDDDGPVLWFCLPVIEPPFHVGTPDDSDWPWGANDMADAKFTAQIGWSRLPRVNQNITPSGPTDSRPSPEAPSPSDGMRGSREHRSGRASDGREEDDGCPVGDPDCMSRSDECHTACEAPKGPACGHSACSQHFIDTGSVACVEGETDGC